MSGEEPQVSPTVDLCPASHKKFSGSLSFTKAKGTKADACEEELSFLCLVAKFFFLVLLKHECSDWPSREG